ncbi:hypothetical protein [Fulvimarina sp. MAC3]|uniref:hypothetical protein n=1 Tax=Fulvimarina sp. MAC3 TaxID=3148887 RepID=UPI0031FE2110
MNTDPRFREIIGRQPEFGEYDATLDQLQVTEIVEPRDGDVLYVRMLSRATTPEGQLTIRSMTAYTQVDGYDVSTSIHDSRSPDLSYEDMEKMLRSMMQTLRADARGIGR